VCLWYIMKPVRGERRERRGTLFCPDNGSAQCNAPDLSSTGMAIQAFEIEMLLTLMYKMGLELCAGILQL